MLMDCLRTPSTAVPGTRCPPRSIWACLAFAAVAVSVCHADDGGVHLPSSDGADLWRRTVASVAADWPIARAIEPDFATGREGLIESAWVEPSGNALASWPPERQRAVVRVAPAADGVWMTAVVQTQALSGQAGGGGGIELVGDWQTQSQSEDVSLRLAAQLAPAAEPIYSLPPLERQEFLPQPPPELPWTRSNYPRLSRAGHKIWNDYRNFYDCEGLVCLSAAFGAGALMANTGFDDTMQTAWQTGVEPTGLGTFFSGCKDIG
ncbi:MAG: hypothetical protein KGR24_10350, partial [Planctomycetes bacterium]|nr:hypothetical protein [Planctomycetota bacterium]